MSASVVGESRWFWVTILLMTVHKEKSKRPEAMTEVFENLHLIRTSSAEAALSRADEIGREGAGDSRGTLRLHGQPAITVYLGLSDAGEVYEKRLEDGVEILWRLVHCRQTTAKKLVKKRSALIKKLEADSV
jgi:hypothetical protein